MAGRAHGAELRTGRMALCEEREVVCAVNGKGARRRGPPADLCPSMSRGMVIKINVTRYLLVVADVLE